VGDRAGVDPLLLAVAAGPDRLDVGLSLLLRCGEVVADDPGVAGLVVELLAGGLEPVDLGSLGEVRQPVPQLQDARVDLLDVQQLQLRERVGLHVGGSSSDVRRAASRDR